MTTFVIQKDGTISDVAIRESSGHHDLDEDAVKTLKNVGSVPSSRCLQPPRLLEVQFPVEYWLNDSNQVARSESGWLISLSRDVEEGLQRARYPGIARERKLEGTVLVSAVIKSDGTISHVWVEQSSSSSILDRAAIQTIRNLSPITLTFPYPPGRSDVTILVPINYRLLL